MNLSIFNPDTDIVPGGNQTQALIPVCYNENDKVIKETTQIYVVPQGIETLGTSTGRETVFSLLGAKSEQNTE